LTWSETSSKSARLAKDFESCETVSIAESAPCPLVRCPAQLATCLATPKRSEGGQAGLSRNETSLYTKIDIFFCMRQWRLRLERSPKQMLNV